MRAHKPGDSPSGYDRDVHHSATVRRLPRREWPTGPLGDALHALSVRWTALNAVEGQPPSSWETERLASRVYTLAHHVSFEDTQQRADMFLEIAALALAGVVQADSAATVDPASGEAA